MDASTLVMFYVLVWIVPCMVIASAKNKSVWTAFFASVLFGVFALIYYIFATGVPPARPTQEDAFKCPDCDVGINPDQKHCPGCGVKLEWGDYRCKRCKHMTAQGSVHCSQCGHRLAGEKTTASPQSHAAQRDQWRCYYCGVTFKSEESLDRHYASCSVKARDERVNKQMRFWLIWALGVLVVAGLCLALRAYWFLIPVGLIAVVASPLGNRLVTAMREQDWWRSARLPRKSMLWGKLATVGAIVVISSLFALGAALGSVLFPSCPPSCDDGDACTKDACSETTGYQCTHEVAMNCSGNRICELGEYGLSDCPDCHDGDKCTTDSIDYSSLACTHTPITPCEGNGVCEAGEYGSKDCPSCDDNNRCTTDGYDYARKRCTHAIVSPCCGDGVCEPSELKSRCRADCTAQSASVSIDRIPIQSSNLYPVRVTVTNNGWESFEPVFDMTVTDHRGKVICEGSPLFSDFTAVELASGESKTAELTILGCILWEDGTYDLSIVTRNKAFTALNTTEKSFVVNDPIRQQLAELQSLYG